VATEGDEAVKDGRTRWGCIHKLQRVHGGRRPVRPTAILKDDGQLTNVPEEVLDCWYQNFIRVLNVRSVYNTEVIEDMPQLEPKLHHLPWSNCPVLTEDKEGWRAFRVTSRDDFCVVV